MEKLMKKYFTPLIAIVLVLTMLVGCSGTPKPPVGNLEDLDELVMLNMTLDQVYALMKPELRQTATLYQAESITQNPANGNWIVSNKPGGFAAGEIGPYQGLWFTPTKAGSEYYMIVFKDDVVTGKAFFAPTNAFYVEQYLKGNNPVNTGGQ
jgi:hypothetical protein